MNNKLTRQQRHIAYIIMREEIESNSTHFMCKAAVWIGVLRNESRYAWGFQVSDKQIKERLPELYLKKPAALSHGSCWFNVSNSGLKSRIALLDQCILETADAWKL